MDQRLRELERRFQETGDPTDEAAFLAHALRAQALDPERLGVAAWAGHGPARAALGGGGQPPADDDRETWVRLALPAVEAAVLPCFPKMPDKDRYPGPARRALVATRAWLRDDRPETRGNAHLVARDFWSDPKSFGPDQRPPFYEALDAAYSLVLAAVAPVVPDPEQHARAQEEHAALTEFLQQRGRRSTLPPPVPIALRPQAEEAVRRARGALIHVCGLEPAEARARLRAAMLRDGVPWLLGRRDPIRERVEVPPDAQARLAEAEARVAAAPADLAAIEHLVALCDEVGWRWDGKTLAEWREQLCGDWNLAKLAVEHLTGIGPRIVPAALAALEVRSYQTPRFAVQLLQALGPDAAAAAPRLLELLADETSCGQAGVHDWVHTLGHLASETAIPRLIELLRVGERAQGAGQALLRIGPPAFPALRSLLVEPLDIDDDPTRYAAFVLAEQGQDADRLAPYLAEVVRSYRHAFHRNAACSGLLALGRADRHVDAILAWLRFLAEQDEEYRAAAPLLALALLDVGLDPQVRDALRPYVNHERGELRQNARAALAGRPPPGVDWRHPFWVLPRR